MMKGQKSEESIVSIRVRSSSAFRVDPTNFFPIGLNGKARSRSSDFTRVPMIPPGTLALNVQQFPVCTKMKSVLREIFERIE